MGVSGAVLAVLPGPQSSDPSGTRMDFFSCCFGFLLPRASCSPARSTSRWLEQVQTTHPLSPSVTRASPSRRPKPKSPKGPHSSRWGQDPAGRCQNSAFNQASASPAGAEPCWVSGPSCLRFLWSLASSEALFSQAKEALKTHLTEKRTCWSGEQQSKGGRRKGGEENDNYLRVIGIRIVVPPGRRANKENGRNCISSFSPAEQREAQEARGHGAGGKRWARCSQPQAAGALSLLSSPPSPRGHSLFAP